MRHSAQETMMYRVMPSMTKYYGAVLSFDEQSIVLKPLDPRPEAFPVGQYLIISDSESDTDYYTVITENQAGNLRLKRMWTGKRDFFRVDDVFPLAYRKVEPAEIGRRGRIIAGLGIEEPSLDMPDDSISPRLWKLLQDINTKLGLILERLDLQHHEGLIAVAGVPVNISASGVRFTSDKPLEIGDVLELKMLLPVLPAVGLVVYGAVVRIEEMEGGRREVAVRFEDVGDDIRDLLIQYALKRQRENIRKIKRWEQEGV